MARIVTTKVSTTHAVQCPKCLSAKVELKDVEKHHIDDELAKKGWMWLGNDIICPDCHAKQMKEWETSDDIRERLAANAYHTKLPYKTRKEDAAAHEAYQKDEARLLELFRKDAFKAVGLENHPKANKAWSFAWERGHAEGLHQVFNELESAAELLL